MTIQKTSIILMLIISLSVGILCANRVTDFLKRTKSCAKVVPAGTKYAFKKVSYKTKMGFLKVADQLEKLDPRLIGLAAEEKGKQTALMVAQQSLSVAQKGLDIAQASVKPISVLGNALAQFTGKGFNVTKAAFHAHINELKQPEVKLELDALIAGKHVHLAGIPFNFAKAAQSIKKSVVDVTIKKLVNSIADQLLDKFNF